MLKNVLYNLVIVVYKNFIIIESSIIKNINFWFLIVLLFLIILFWLINVK